MEALKSSVPVVLDINGVQIEVGDFCKGRNLASTGRWFYAYVTKVSPSAVYGPWTVVERVARGANYENSTRWNLYNSSVEVVVLEKADGTRVVGRPKYLQWRS